MQRKTWRQWGSVGLMVVGSLSAPMITTSAGAAGPQATPALASTGCRGPVTPPGTTTQSFVAAHETGSFIEHVPTSASPRAPRPLIIDLHGWSESAAIQAMASDWNTFGDAHGFITVTPEVTYAVPHWNTALGSQDLAFFEKLMTHLEKTLCVDERRIFVTGYSNGAFMASAVACQLAGRVAAVGAVAGLETAPRCRAPRPVPVVAFHGTADPYVAYNGGVGPKALQLPSADGSGKTLGDQVKGKKIPGLAPIATNAAVWAKRNGCAPKPSVKTVAKKVTLIRYSCPRNAAVELYRVNGGGHSWPGSTFTRSIASVVGTTTMAINADQIMWAFFQAHPLTTHAVRRI
ncbi:MAG: PHB depolymerase family esterase [Actinomycetes bacterium]